MMTCLEWIPDGQAGKGEGGSGDRGHRSFFAGTFRRGPPMFLAMPISALGMKFGAPEYFAIMLLAVDHGGQPGYRVSPQGAIYGAFGPVLSDHRSRYPDRSIRFTFGSNDLVDGN